MDPRLVPELICSDLERSLAFYTGVLGFAVRYSRPAERARANESSIHVDFMIGSNEVDVSGVTREGERVPVLRDGAWHV